MLNLENTFETAKRALTRTSKILFSALYRRVLMHWNWCARAKFLHGKVVALQMLAKLRSDYEHQFEYEYVWISKQLHFQTAFQRLHLDLVFDADVLGTRLVFDVITFCVVPSKGPCCSVQQTVEVGMDNIQLCWTRRARILIRYC